MPKTCFRCRREELQKLRNLICWLEMRRDGVALQPQQRLAAEMAEELLTGHQTDLLRLYYVDGLNMVQIGKQRGISSSCASRAVSRGRERVLKVLGQIEIIYGRDCF